VQLFFQMSARWFFDCAPFRRDGLLLHLPVIPSEVDQSGTQSRNPVVRTLRNRNGIPRLRFAPLGNAAVDLARQTRALLPAHPVARPSCSRDSVLSQMKESDEREWDDRYIYTDLWAATSVWRDFGAFTVAFCGVKLSRYLRDRRVIVVSNAAALIFWLRVVPRRPLASPLAVLSVCACRRRARDEKSLAASRPLSAPSVSRTDLWVNLMLFEVPPESRDRSRKW